MKVLKGLQDRKVSNKKISLPITFLSCQTTLLFLLKPILCGLSLYLHIEFFVKKTHKG